MALGLLTETRRRATTRAREVRDVQDDKSRVAAYIAAAFQLPNVSSIRSASACWGCTPSTAIWYTGSTSRTVLRYIHTVLAPIDAGWKQNGFSLSRNRRPRAPPVLSIWWSAGTFTPSSRPCQVTQEPWEPCPDGRAFRTVCHSVSKLQPVNRSFHVWRWIFTRGEPVNKRATL